MLRMGLDRALSSMAHTPMMSVSSKDQKNTSKNKRAGIGKSLID